MAKKKRPTFDCQSHDDWTDLLDELKKYKGEFEVDVEHQVRHKTLRTPKWAGNEGLCPLAALLNKRRLSFTPLNTDVDDFIYVLKLPMEMIERFMEAADFGHFEPGSYPVDEQDRLRQRIIDACC